MKKWNLKFETIPFTLAPHPPTHTPRNERLRCKTKKYGHDVYENYKTLMKEIK